MCPPDAIDRLFQPHQVHVPFERRLAMGVVGLLDHQVESLSSLVLDVGAGGVEVDVVRHAHARLHDRGEQEIFGHASLVRGDDVLVTEDRTDRFFKMVIVSTACIRLVAQHHAGPLVVAHGGGAAVGQQVHVDAFGGDLKQVIAGLAQQAIPFLARRATNGLHHLDLEGLGGKLHVVDLLKRANSILNACGPQYSNTYRVMSKSGAGSRSRSNSGFHVISS